MQLRIPVDGGAFDGTGLSLVALDRFGNLLGTSTNDRCLLCVLADARVLQFQRRFYSDVPRRRSQKSSGCLLRA